MPNVHGSKWCWPATRLAIYLRDSFKCVYCGRDLHDAPPRVVTLDHLVPRAKGGTNDPSNLVTACRRCNDQKNDMPWRMFVMITGTQPLRIIREILNARRRRLNYALAREILNGTTRPEPTPRDQPSARNNPFIGA